jgi:hypothetical protein
MSRPHRRPTLTVCAAIAAAVAVAVAVAVAAPTTATAAAAARPSTQFMFDTASWDGAESSLQATTHATSRTPVSVHVTDMIATLQMPPDYASHDGVGGFCAYAELRVDERTVWTSWTGCDTTDDARLRYHFPDRWVPANAQVSVYFSDERTRYLGDHPWLSV